MKNFALIDSAQHLLDPRLIERSYIATPVVSHLDLLLQSTSRGIPTLVEKPMLFGLDQVRMIDLQQRRLITPAFKKRYSSLSTALKAIDHAKYSDDLTVSYSWIAGYPGDNHWKINKDISGGGAVMDLASHIFDLFEYSIGRIAELHVEESVLHPEQKSDSYVRIQGSFESGGRFRLTVGWTADKGLQRLAYENRDTSIYWSKTGSGPISDLHIIRNGELERKICDRYEEYDCMFFRFMNRFDKINDLPSFDDGVRNLELIDLVHASIY